MSVFRINSVDGRMFHPDVPAREFENLLAQRLADVPPTSPVVIMLHGYKFSPLRPAADPHQTLFARDVKTPHWKIRSWPRQMGMADLSDHNGLAIGFAWHGRSDALLAGPSLREVYARAGAEGENLARLINLIARIDPGRKIDIMAHSMGARVALASLCRIKQPNVGRVIMMGAAEFGAIALEALQSRVAREARFYNITARQNDFYDILFELLANCPGPADRSLGMSFPFVRSNWVNIQIDDPLTLRKLQSMGIRISAPIQGFCHWSFYTREGIFNLYQAIINRHPGFTPNALATRLGPMPKARKRRAILTMPVATSRWLPLFRPAKG